MSLLARLRLCLLVLQAHRARDWRMLTTQCQQQQLLAGNRALLAAMRKEAARQDKQVTARLLAEARALTQPKQA